MMHEELSLRCLHQDKRSGDSQISGFAQVNMSKNNNDINSELRSIHIRSNRPVMDPRSEYLDDKLITTVSAGDFYLTMNA